MPTQHDARQLSPALIVLKEENNNNNNTGIGQRRSTTTTTFQIVDNNDTDLEVSDTCVRNSLLSCNDHAHYGPQDEYNTQRSISTNN